MNVFFINSNNPILLISRSSYLNLILLGLNTVQPTISPNGTNTWNVSETCQLDLKILLENFTVNSDLWSKNEKKLQELFTVVDE